MAVIAIVVVPLLLFGIELIVLGLVVAAGIVGRTLLGRPWNCHGRPGRPRCAGLGMAGVWLAAVGSCDRGNRSCVGCWT